MKKQLQTALEDPEGHLVGKIKLKVWGFQYLDTIMRKINNKLIKYRMRSKIIRININNRRIIYRIKVHLVSSFTNTYRT